MTFDLEGAEVRLDVFGRGVWFGPVLLGTVSHRRRGKSNFWQARSLMSGITYVTEVRAEAIADIMMDAKPLLKLLVSHNIRPGTTLAV